MGQAKRRCEEENERVWSAPESRDPFGDAVKFVSGTEITL